MDRPESQAPEIPRRWPSRINRQDALKRAGLYGAALLIILLGLRAHRSLKMSASAADLPYEQIAVFEGELRDNGLAEGLEESGADPAEAKAILTALRKVGGAASTRKGDAYRIARSTDGTLLHLTLVRGQKQVVLTPDGEGFSTRLSNVVLFDVEVTAEGKLAGSLWLSMAGRGVPAEIIQEYADVFQWTVDFLTEPRDQDDFAVTWVERRSPDGRVWKRDIQAALYLGKRTGRQTGILYDGEYYDHNGLALKRMFLRAPLNYRRISSFFSRGRWHPVLRKRRPHHGVDYAAPTGTPVVSVGGGTVAEVGWKGGFGKRVEIRHNGSYLTLYGHLSRFHRGIHPGTHVRQGEVIGYVGSTGLATGPHLHFQVAKDGRWVDFLRLSLPRTKSVRVKNKTEFAALRDRRMLALTGKPFSLESASIPSGSGR